jgi:hypothetical protein
MRFSPKMAMVVLLQLSEAKNLDFVGEVRESSFDEFEGVSTRPHRLSMAQGSLRRMRVCDRSFETMKITYMAEGISPIRIFVCLTTAWDSCVEMSDALRA